MLPYSLGWSLLASKDLDRKQGMTFIDCKKQKLFLTGALELNFRPSQAS